MSVSALIDEYADWLRSRPLGPGDHRVRMTLVSNQSNDSEQISRGRIQTFGLARTEIVPYVPIVSYATGYVQAYNLPLGGYPFADPANLVAGSGTIVPVGKGTPIQTVLSGVLDVFFSDREWIRHESGDRGMPFDPGSVDRLRVRISPDDHIYLTSLTWGDAHNSVSLQEQNRVLFGFTNGITNAQQALYSVGLAKVFIPTT